MSTDTNQLASQNGGTTAARRAEADGEGRVSSSGQLPNSRKVFVPGQLHPDIRVPFREISLASTKTMSGEMEGNEPVRVYDTSGPWGDDSVTLDPVKGLPPLREPWVLQRGDVEQIDGRAVTPIDDGYLSDKHAATANGQNGKPSSILHSPSSPSRRPLRAKNGNAVTQLAYARRGIITPEMEFIAIRENQGSARASRAPFGASPNGPTSDLRPLTSDL